ncbi:Gag protease polyprotein [Gossypium australe]|uniref:Gag protease polyprotein n=1 Tax=Gossypium australe TaxID=47621 RepID=A0A5B6UY83_9ROSI|nr:Gag protease polyprotein [Gossypium australe]
MILHEAHSGCLSVHPGSTKMYNDLKKWYWWSGRTPSTFGFTSTSDGTRVEIGYNYDGLRDGFTFDFEKQRCRLGYC